MKSTAKAVAGNATFQAFANCYLREIDPGVWHGCTPWQMRTGLGFDGNEQHVVELQLLRLNVTVAVGVSFRSIVGRHKLTCAYRQCGQWQWEKLDDMAAVMLLIREIYTDNSDDTAGHEMELMARVIDSCRSTETFIAERTDDPALHSNTFIDADQSLIFGHWLHPTPKSRPGIHTWQQAHYTPELCGEFQLHFFAAERALVSQSSIAEQSAEQIAYVIAGHGGEALPEFTDDRVLLPVHPLQAQWLLHQPHVQSLLKTNQLIDVGRLGARFTPTSSLRTLYCASLDFMVKLSVPVKITNSLRINMHHELDAGVVVAKLLRACGFSKQYPVFQTIDDPAYLTLTLPDCTESGFETIFRDNPFRGEKADSAVLCIAALTQEPLTSETPSRLAAMVNALAKRNKLSRKKAAMQWFDAYWHCAIEPAIRLYDSYGVALEAHQQNSLLEIRNGLPQRYYYRDNQGFYLSQSHRTRLLQLEPELIKTRDLFYPDDMIRDRCGYYLFVNQLFSVINRLALDGLIGETELLRHTQQKLQQLKTELDGVGAALIDSVLERRALPCKGNLLTRVEDLDELQAELELAVYTHIDNPLRVVVHATENRLRTGEAYLESA